ncbi:TetR/AcrR family transcriptional regulator [Bradyrhizobium lablabi]|uniref:TetR/AcrR family transcriptional regulator n=1 Tax=Bradyrhizobium lablabi TaxID=722472 RepID=UPI001BAAC19C|nr:TetR/AcrR family transcriptional regulator [Bradyrhizobium lablabi]MBR1125946.1 TetR/AcrR family transcriptional regulator [Bradyrhizobium lablabi]
MALALVRRQLIEETHKRIVRVTRDLIAEGGWAAAQISVIARRAGLATGSVYRYFDSKVDLCVQVLAEVSEREAEVVAGIIDSEGDAASRLRDAVKAFVRRAARKPRLAYALIAEPCEPQLDEARLKYRDALAEQFARLIAEGTRRGEFVDMPADLLSTCITGAIMEPLIRPLARMAAPSNREIDALAENVASVCVRMVRASEAKLSVVKRRKPQ